MSVTRNGNTVYIEIQGECCSKANSRRMVPGRSKAGKLFMRPIKSDKALSFLAGANAQVPALQDLLKGELTAHISIWYPSERNDLDESLVLDVLQGRIYKNDRQVRERHVYHFIDRDRPRVTVRLEPRDPSKKVLDTQAIS